MQGFAIAKLGMSDREFRFSEPRAFYNALKVWMRFYEDEQIHSYNRARKIAYSAASPYLPKWANELAYWPFPWDEMTIKDLVTRFSIPEGEKLESIKALHEKYSNMMTKQEMARLRNKFPKKDIKQPLGGTPSLPN